MRSVENGKERTLADTIGGGVLLWAVLTCPSEEAWLEFVEDVVHAQECDCYKDQESLTWRIITAYMLANMPEA